MSKPAGARRLGGRAHRVALVAAGAARGAAAFAALLGREVSSQRPVLDGSVPPAEMGVFFDVSGAATGALALLFGGQAAEATVLALGAGEVAAESALCEAANIVASQTVSAVADMLGGRLTISVPHLESKDAGARFEARLARAGRKPALVAEFMGPDDSLRAWLVVGLDPDPVAAPRNGRG